MIETETLLAAVRARESALRKLNHRVRFDLTDTSASFLLDARAKAMTITEAAAGEDAETVLRLTSDNLLKLIEGKLNPMIAFATGRLRVEGSQGVALKLAGLLEDG